jgi:DNA-binding PadR family transcriptional regulator
MKHMAVAPKGLLRYYVLEILSKEPRSGSEIMDLVEEHSGGLWRPSPGSIYPLLEWLKSRGYIKETQSDEAGIKRYTLTEKGRKLLEEQRKVKAFMTTSWRVFAPYFLDLAFYKSCSDERRELINALKNFMQAFFSLEAKLREKNGKEYVESAIKVLKDATSRLGELEKEIEGETDD